MSDARRIGQHAHILPNGRTVALGRPRPSLYDDPRTASFRLARFLRPSQLPPLEEKLVHPEAFVPRMFRNDRIGDCTIAGEANYVLLAACYDLFGWQVSDDDVVARYAKLTGYDPQTGENDNGAIEMDVLKDWHHDPFNGVELAAFASVDVHDTQLLRYAIQLFGAVYVGLSLPTSAQSQVGHLWDVTPDTVPGSWGGHCVIITDADWTGGVHELQCATWGGFQRMSEAFWRTCGDEAYAPLPSLWKANPRPGVDWTLLDQELAQMGRRQ